MLLRLAILLAIGCVLFRWAFGEWPWSNLMHGSKGGARRQGLAKARALLGVTSAASREEIIAAHRRLAALVHPDRGGSNDALREANAARDLLLGELPPTTGQD
ncbi:MAG: molecular chaperone DnaJ [Erythrobacter sp. SCN 62-14]|nr:MAG: molecular chaperone DnaJ [Erythrobacter sp. SCN 62-14]